MACRAFGLAHSPLVRCEIAAAINKAPYRSSKDVTENRRARGVYNAYMREYMRKRRAG